MSLALAFAVVRTVSPLVLVAIVGFAVLYAVLDLFELSHQVAESRMALALFALLIATFHMAATLIALRLVMNDRRAATAAA